MLQLKKMDSRHYFSDLSEVSSVLPRQCFVPSKCPGEEMAAICLVLYSIPVVPNLGPPDVLGLQFPEILASRDGGEGFWEL